MPITVFAIKIKQEMKFKLEREKVGKIFFFILLGSIVKAGLPTGGIFLAKNHRLK